MAQEVDGYNKAHRPLSGVDLTAGHWCRTHHSSSPKLPIACPSCMRNIHIHQADVDNAKRGWTLLPTCPRCRRVFQVRVEGTRVAGVKVLDRGLSR